MKHSGCCEFHPDQAEGVEERYWEEGSTISRKDPKGRVLRSGEGYRKDKNLYIFQYRDGAGHPHTIYAGNIMDLRKKEDEITRDRLDGIRSYASESTSLNDAFDRYIILKHDIKPSTVAAYKYTYNHFVRDKFGNRMLKNIRYSDVKAFYWSMIKEAGLKPSTVDNIHTILHPIFEMCIRDGLLRLNPTKDVMREIKKSNAWATEPRHALTIEQTKVFMDFTETHPIYNHWLTLFAFMFGTGMRVSEVCGLCWDDLEFEKNEIHVRRNLLYTEWEGSDKSTFHVTTPKTIKGIRTIPMMDEVREALLAEYRHQQMTGFCRSVVDGVSGFVFRNKLGKPLHQGLINRAIKRVYESYNADEEKNAFCESRKPELLPHFSCHIMRHTFCTRLCERETNVKVIQEIMGHADIQTTLDIYAEVTDAVKHKTMVKLQDGRDLF